MEGIARVYANDIDPSAVQLIGENVIKNKMGEMVKPLEGDCNANMHILRCLKKEEIDVIDLDPFGSSAPYLDTATQIVANGGLLAITCTDMQVLASSTWVETCYAKYGGTPFNGEGCHEGALRLLLNAIESSANRHGRYIEPLLSVSADFYVRVYVRIHSSKSNVKMATTRRGIVARCVECKSSYPHPVVTRDDKGNTFRANSEPVVSTCPLCGGATEMCGPFYLDALHNKEFLQYLLDQAKLLVPGDENAISITNTSSQAHPSLTTVGRIEGMTTMMMEEVTGGGGALFYRQVSALTRFFRSQSIPHATLKSALLNANYAVSGTHCNPDGIKTTAPPAFIYKVILEWGKSTNPSLGAQFPLDSPQRNMMEAISKIDTPVNFTLHPLADPPSRVNRLVRFQGERVCGFHSM